MKAANPQTPTHWSKDFVEHLRTVHFTLIALCVGLMVLASFPSTTQIKLAHEQIEQILNATRPSQWKPKFLLTEANNNRRDAIRADFNGTWQLNSDDSATLKYLISVTNPDDAPVQWGPFSPRISFIGLPKKIGITYGIKEKLKAPLAEPQMLIDVPSDLRSFKQLWDELAQGGQLPIPRLTKTCISGWIESQGRVGVEEILDTPISVRETPCKLIELDKKQTLESNHFMDLQPNLLLRPFPIAKLHEVLRKFGHKDNPDTWEDAFAEVQDYSNHGFSFVLLPIEQYFPVTFDTHTFLIRLIPEWKDFDRRSFHDSFPQLDAVDTAFEDAPISSAERILRAEEQRSGDAFEAAGLKIPADVAVKFGTLLIFGVQLYLLIHLREFGNRIDREAGFEVAWIGVYTSSMARLMLILSLLALPACTVGVLSYRALLISESQWKWAIWLGIGTAVATCFLLSYLIFRALPQRPAKQNVAIAAAPPFLDD
jgi:hypothetical protein